jgi:hypothetical protein
MTNKPKLNKENMNKQTLQNLIEEVVEGFDANFTTWETKEDKEFEQGLMWSENIYPRDVKRFLRQSLLKIAKANGNHNSIKRRGINGFK